MEYNFKWALKNNINARNSKTDLAAKCIHFTLHVKWMML